jgi:hypothetical protein
MTPDEELKRLIARIRAWCNNELRRYERELPEYEYLITKKRFDAFLNRARYHHRRQAIPVLRDMVQEMNYFILPWEALTWYASQKKKSV